MAVRPCRNSARLRQRLSTVYASATRAGSRVFHASSAMRVFCAAVSAVKRGSGGRSIEWSLISAQPFVEEIADQGDHLVGLVLQGEVAGVEEMKFHVREVTLVWMGAIDREDLVVLAPDDQRRRLAFAE